MSSRKIPVVMILSALALAACGDSGNSNGSIDSGAAQRDASTAHGGEHDSGRVLVKDAGPQPVDSAAITTLTGCDALKLDAPADGVQYEMPLSVPAANEREYCMLVMLQEDLNLNWSDGVYTPGSHHALVHRTSYKGSIPTKTINGDDFPNADQPHPCGTPTALWDSQGVIAGGRSILHADQVDPAGGKGTLPDDVAFKLKKGDVLLLNFHMINSTEQPIDACYKVNLHGIPDKQVKIEAGTVFFYNTSITVPANGQSKARMSCPVTLDIKLAMAVSHMHSRGDDYWARLYDRVPTDPAAKFIKEIYDGKVWSEPTARRFSPPLALKAGQWIDYQCHYTNPESRNVAQGYKSTDEMCMLIGTYWPRNREFEICAVPGGQSGSNGIQYGDGTKTGAEFLQCFWDSPQVFTGGGDNPARYQTLSCLTQTCPKASAGQWPYVSCLSMHTPSCKSDCSDAQASFQATCATTPDLCGAQYGDPAKSGTGGTCYANALTPPSAGEAAPAVAACTKPDQLNEFTKQCQANQCKTDCATSADACTKCLGTFDGDPQNTSCMNVMIGACVSDQAQKMTTACVTQCFTDCITKLQTSCVVDCLNEVECKNEYATVAAATCN